MKVSDSAQAGVFLINILFGMICILIYDIFRAMRHIWGKSTVSTNIFDIIYFAVSFCVVFTAGIKYNFGALRYYQIMGLIAGAAIQILLFSRYEVKLCEILIKGAVFLIKAVLKVILFLPLLLIRAAASLLGFLEEKTMDFCDKTAVRMAKRGRKKRKNKKIIKKRIKML